MNKVVRGESEDSLSLSLIKHALRNVFTIEPTMANIILTHSPILS